MSENGVGNTHERVNAAGIVKIKSAAKSKSHNLIILCDYQNLPAFHRLTVTEVQLDQDKDAGDIYMHSLSKKWCLHHQGRLKLAMAANIEWGEPRTVQVTPDYIHMQAEGAIRKEYGHMIRWCGDCELDREGLRERLLLESADTADYRIKDGKLKAADKDTWVRNKVAKELTRVWTNRMKLAATAAKSVVIDKLLNLKSGYKDAKEIGRPWLVVRCQMAPDLDDPATRRQLNQLAVMAMAGVYGPTALAATPAALPPSTDAVDAEIVPPTVNTPPPEDFSPHEHDDEQPAPPFAEWPEAKQLAELRRLIKITGYDTSKLPKTIEDMQPRNRERFHGVLSGLPAAEEERKA